MDPWFRIILRSLLADLVFAHIADVNNALLWY